MSQGVSGGCSHGFNSSIAPFNIQFPPLFPHTHSPLAHPPVPTFPITGGEEAMECERWETEEEVAMDVDITEVEQLQLISEVKFARSTMVPPSSLESFGIPQDPSPATLPVSHEGLTLVLVRGLHPSL